ILKEINDKNVKIEDLKHDEGDISKKIINQLKDKPLAKDLFDELHKKCNEKYTELIANNAEELAEELKKQINEEKSSKNLENIKKN
ncbi:16946_t:CDS:1, partial [Dentiscutata erythropus]